jgi:hypothetical protein
MAQITLNSSGVASNGTLALQSNGTTTAVTIDTSQNVGIGTSTVIAGAKLNTLGWVASSNSNTDRIVIGQDSRGTSTVFGLPTGSSWVAAVGNAVANALGIGTFGSDPLVFGTNNTERARIDSSGNFLLGGTSTTQLDGVFGQVIGSSSKSSAGITLESSAGAYLMYTDSTDALIFYDATSNLERARIDSSGNLLVARTSASFLGGGAKFGVEQISSGAWGIGINANNNAMVFNHTSNTSSAVGSITVTTSATAFNTSSDYRLKNTIAPMTGALAKVALLKPVTYKWNFDGSSGEGFIAHELQAVVPDAVTGEKDAVETYTDEDGVEQTRPVYQGIDTSFLVATLTAAIQEQQALITTLTDRITALEAK